MFEKFKQKAEAINAELHLFKSKAEALEFIKDFIKQNTSKAISKEVVWCDSIFLEGIDKDALQKELPQIEFNIDLNSASSARIGINQADFGIAETGSLVEISEIIFKRLCSILPEIHIAILPLKKILPDIESVMNQIDMKKIPYMTIISGPSRTADIERVLTIGVHGPERVIILCVDNF
ncbi:LutC/YkgG family protein [Thermodesulfovibrio yellowstonii]|uniref:LutC/YkgG family protein n=1 Tax=Thermodesulfovibrio yellowstonii TaxID=28262 RepID=UPI0024B38C4B|nr:lactate utilization protein [Thermodesulfovibrio yellowstonii]MDI6864767.1 lactate utilization protein [Thermodesulfovibrio yellowstonii]